MIKSSLSKKTASLIVVIFFLISPVFGQKETDTLMHILDLEEYIIQMKIHEQHTLIDVRTWMEYKKGRIPGALLAESSKILFTITDTVDFDRPLFLYCATDFRSKSSGKLLVNKGFNNIYILESGYSGWKAAGKEIDKSKPKRKGKHEKKSGIHSQ